VTETPDWRARRWATTHERIYRCALELFGEHGFDAVNVGQIAAAADVSVPTFYAHYPSKDHLVMQLPSADDVLPLLAEFSPGLPVAAQFRHAVPQWISQWSQEFRDDVLDRWRIVAATPSLRTRAAGFERATAHVLSDALAATPGVVSRESDAIVISAYMSAYTAALLKWADCGGEVKLEELMDESFGALEQR
jgi:AcrR family transcriptional regulator